MAIGRTRLAVHFARGILAAHDVRVHLAGRQRTDGPEQFDLFIADGFGLQRHRRFHRHQGEHLQQVVLHHVTQGAGFLVITAAGADAQFLAHRNLDVVHRLAVPELLENRIGKTEHQNVLDRFLAEVMVDAENLFFMREPGEFGV